MKGNLCFSGLMCLCCDQHAKQTDERRTKRSIIGGQRANVNQLFQRAAKETTVWQKVCGSVV